MSVSTRPFLYNMSGLFLYMYRLSIQAQCSGLCSRTQRQKDAHDRESPLRLVLPLLREN